MNYYNEFDKKAAEHLRNLIREGHIAPGDVDERSIEDVLPSDLDGYTQCHFFAGVGVWSLALRDAGWPDDRKVWTGSCPCQPFSAAGKGDGFADERHLWPAWLHLIEECRPTDIFGEQVANKDAEPWIDLVHADLEALGYAFGCVPFPSASVGAPHIRDRSFWVAHTNHTGLEGRGGMRQGSIEWPAWSNGLACRVGKPDSNGRKQRKSSGATARQGGAALATGNVGGVADAERQRIRSGGQGGAHDAPGAMQELDRERQRIRSDAGSSNDSLAARPGPVNGFWRSADWLGCTDGKWRPVEPGTFPLAHGAPARVGRLRAYGNAINAVQAKVFIEAYLDFDADEL